MREKAVPMAIMQLGLGMKECAREPRKLLRRAALKRATKFKGSSASEQTSLTIS